MNHAKGSSAHPRRLSRAESFRKFNTFKQFKQRRRSRADSKTRLSDIADMASGGSRDSKLQQAPQKASRSRSDSTVSMDSFKRFKRMKLRIAARPSVSRLPENSPTNIGLTSESSEDLSAVDRSQLALEDTKAMGNGGGLQFLYGGTPPSTTPTPLTPEKPRSSQFDVILDEACFWILELATADSEVDELVAAVMKEVEKTFSIPTHPYIGPFVHSNISEMAAQRIQDAVSQREREMHLANLPPVWSEKQEMGGEFRKGMLRYWKAVEGQPASEIALGFKQMRWTQQQAKKFVHMIRRVSSTNNPSEIVQAIESAFQ